MNRSWCSSLSLRARVRFNGGVTCGDSKSWFLRSSGPGESAFNMACDEALLKGAVSAGRPVLRFYGWTEPAATFGYFQKYAEIERMTPLRPLLRRPTGGGLVPHDADWTYSLVFPPSHAWYALRAVASYRQLHEWLQAAFARLAVNTVLSAVSRKEAPGQCFTGAELYDLLHGQRKIAGAAQRRNRLGLLIQGSVQPAPNLARAAWEQALCEAAQERWGVQWIPWEATAGFRQQAEALAAHKYAQPAYNRRR